MWVHLHECEECAWCAQRCGQVGGGLCVLVCEERACVCVCEERVCVVGWLRLLGRRQRESGSGASVWCCVRRVRWCVHLCVRLRVRRCEHWWRLGQL